MIQLDHSLSSKKFVKTALFKIYMKSSYIESTTVICRAGLFSPARTFSFKGRVTRRLEGYKNIGMKFSNRQVKIL